MCWNSIGLEECSERTFSDECEYTCDQCRKKDKLHDHTRDYFTGVLDILFGKERYNEDKLHELLDETAFSLGISLAKEKYEDLVIRKQ